MKKKEANSVRGLSLLWEMHLESEAPLQLLNVKFYSIERNGDIYFFRFIADFLQYEAK